MQQPPLRSIGIFFQLGRLNSVSRAAEYLGVTPSAVSQQIRALEEQLGTKLVRKIGREIRLTEAGERYYEMIAGNIENIWMATQQLTSARKTDILNIRATPSISTKWILPRLPNFIEKYPGLDLRLDASNEPVDFARDKVDIEIRHGEGQWPGLHVKPLVTESFVPVCSPRLAGPRSLGLAELQSMRLIYSVKSQLQWSTWLFDQGMRSDVDCQKIYFDRSYMAVDAAVLGIGVALESLLMMENELLSGKLVVPIAQAPVYTLTTQWIVCPPHHLRRNNVKRFINWIEHEAAIWLENCAEMQKYF
jgi:LysR family transcriptional regulator, glycine cleavage system transcriptional activator